MKALTTLLILLLTLGSFTSCSDNSEEVLVKQDMDPQVTSLLGDLTELEENIAEGMVLRTTSTSEKAEIKALLKRIRILSMRLGQFPKDYQAIMALYKALKQIENMDLTMRDQGIFTGMLQTLRVTVDKFATVQNINFEGLVWDLYSYAFAEGLGPFQQVATKANGASWEIALNKFAKIGGRGTPTDNWLVSPTLDLAKVNKAELVLKHTVRNPNWEKFKMLVSDNYKGGNPAESDWVELDIKPTKAVAENAWVDLESKPLSLDQFAGKKVVIAFRYISETESNSVWEVLSFEFKGTGDGVSVSSYPITYKLPEPPAPTPNPGDLDKEVVFQHSFNDGMGAFSQEQEAETAALFREMADPNGKNLVRISSFNRNGPNQVGVSRLSSPEIDLKGKKDVVVEIEQAYKYYNNRSLGLLTIQASEVGKDKVFELKPIKLPSGADFDPVKSGNMELPAQLQNKTIQISFIYKSLEDENPLWDLHSLTIKAGKEN